MDPSFLGLPPIKNIRLMQKQEEEEKELQNQQLHHDEHYLPAKKRKESRVSTPSIPLNTYSLPAKKRVWALHPDFSSNDVVKVSSFDLNVEFKPPQEEEEIIEEVNPVVHDDKPIDNEIEIEKVDDFDVNDNVADDVDDEDGKPINNTHTPLAPNEIEIEKIEDFDVNVNVSDDVDDGDDEDGIVCDVCKSTDGDELDPIVLCDGCDLMVHASCYGNPLVKGIPEGDWFCERCKLSLSSKGKKKNGVKNEGKAITCCLCPTKEGAMKQTVDGRWAHIVCGLLVPEVFFKDPEGREGIDCSKVPEKRWNERCYICECSSSGCAIVCSEAKCRLAFHVTCGLKEDLSIEYREGKKNATIVAGFCKTHTELWKKQQLSGKYKIVAEEGK